MTKLASVREEDGSERQVGLGMQLSDEDLEHVMGGLSRVWTPFSDRPTDAAVAPPSHEGVPATVAATGLKA